MDTEGVSYVCTLYNVAENAMFSAKGHLYLFNVKLMQWNGFVVAKVTLASSRRYTTMQIKFFIIPALNSLNSRTYE